MSTRRRPFKPYVPPRPPAGSYDPGLDSQLAAGARGLQDVQYDSGLTGARNRTDYELARGDVGQNFDRSTADIGQQYGRANEDLATSRTRGTQDYNANVALLQRSYQRLGVSQQQQQNAAGVLRGGAALQAAAKRTANEATDRQPLDTNYQRFLDDSAQRQARLGTDQATATTRLGEDTNTQYGRLGLGYERQGQDLGTALSRAQREQTALGIDTTAAEAAQAAGAGWAPPGRGEKGGRPANEFTDAQGAYRLNRVGNTIQRVRPSGLVDLTRRARTRR